MEETRRLCEKELQMKREKRLCFRCDDLWSIGHKCKKEFRVLLAQEEEVELERREEPNTKH